MSVSQQSNHSATSNRWLPLQGQQCSQCNVIFTLYGASSLYDAASYSHHYLVQLYMHTTRLDVACTLNTVPCSVTFTLCITVQSLVLQSLSEELCSVTLPGSGLCALWQILCGLKLVAAVHWEGQGHWWGVVDATSEQPR